ncbi:iron complex transport system substrate-binding protein (plasmid) [Ketogulonicigenium robustum]|uniref:Iron complex transport system substrate-binding protein n=1 Tax=Ketogulonicigenium robustum TaxID=92947 RepID=A0A1W6P342_9RHOB|nr:ABC transporter substrate-binding protein [Ketogulonicigenium robustum]ARO15925.1 iron complex transport system substrate-binding protein [Ketogulonicigenium robustum]
MIPRLTLTFATLAVATLAPLAATAQTRAIIDATGRTVDIPTAPEAVFAAGPPAAVLLYALKPDAMVGWVNPVKEGDRPYLLPATHDLPTLGRLTGRGDTLNLETLLGSGAQMIVDYGTVNPTYADLATRVQDQANLPYVLIEGSFANMSAAITQMADVLNVPERGAALAEYTDATLAGLDTLLASVPQADRPRVYLARGPEGLETAGPASLNGEIIARVGGVNVADVEGSGLATVSAEQLQAWAPDVIITVDADFAANVADMPEWQGIPAVENGRVYLAPNKPFGFIDSPPSINRLAGVIWLEHKLYPDALASDLTGDIRGFYSLFYGVTPDDAAMAALLGE